MSESPAESVTSSLTKKIGPFPGWVYVLIIVVIAYAVYYFRSRSGGTVEPRVVESVGPENGTANPLPGASPATNETTENGYPSANTNAIWSRNVTNALVSQGSDPTTVSNAVTKYMSGQPLSVAEKAVINTAITKFGVPPEGVIPVKVAPAPAPAPAPTAKPSTKPAPVPSKPAPKPAPPKATVYTVRPGDSLSAIAQRFYGNASAWMKIYNANKGKIGGNPNLIHPGLALTIPR